MKQQEKALNFEVVFEPEAEGGFHIYCPALKGCHSYGATKEEALANIIEAIELWRRAPGIGGCFYGEAYVHTS